MKSILPICINRIVATLLALFLVPAHAAGSGSAQAPAPVQLVDRIVAVVNNDVITQFELNDRIQLIV